MAWRMETEEKVRNQLKQRGVKMVTWGKGKKWKDSETPLVCWIICLNFAFLWGTGADISYCMGNSTTQTQQSFHRVYLKIICNWWMWEWRGSIRDPFLLLITHNENCFWKCIFYFMGFCPEKNYLAEFTFSEQLFT